MQGDGRCTAAGYTRRTLNDSILMRRPQMEAVLAALIRELKTLRKGRGLYVRQVSERVGPTLRRVCNVLASDGPADIRRKVSDQLEALAGALPEDLRTAITAAFAINPEARLPFYQDRV